MKINLGCGFKKKKGFINIDMNKACHPDVFGDCFVYIKSLPDDCVDVVYSSHYLEHIEPQDYHPFLRELYRVSKHDCIWHFILPFANHRNTYGNGLHFRAYTHNHFHAFSYGKNNYSGVLVEILKPKNTPVFVRWFYEMFPMLLHEIEFYLRVQKP